MQRLKSTMKAWFTVRDIVRFATMVMCAILTGMVSLLIYFAESYEHREELRDQALATHTVQLAEINNKLTTVLDKQDSSGIDITTNKQAILILNQAINRNTTDIQVLFTKFADSRSVR